VVHGRRTRVRSVRALHELSGRASLLLLILAGGVAAQEWSGASLRGGRQVVVPPGYRAEVVARGLRLPQDLAVDPSGALWVLARAARSERAAGTLIRVPLDAPEPIDASRLLAVPVAFAPSTVPFEAGSVARDPRSGDLYVSEARGHHLYRVTPDGQVTLFARGGNALADGRALVFDAQGRLLVLDYAGRTMVAEVTTDSLRDLLDAADAYQGPVVHWLRVDEPLPLPRNLEHTGVAFPPGAVRHRRAVLPRYSSLAVLPSGDLTASAGNGVIDRLRPDGTTARLAQLTGAGAVVADGANHLYAVDYPGGRIVRVHADGIVEPFAEGLTRPAALAILDDRAVVVAEDTGRLIRIVGTSTLPR
jgi:hypothetical protein